MVRQSLALGLENAHESTGAGRKPIIYKKMKFPTNVSRSSFQIIE